MSVVQLSCRGVLFGLYLAMILANWVLNPSVGNAAVYYVAPNGGDANPGTKEKPFRTIVKGVGSLAPGDTLYLRQGTYPEAITVKTAIKSGTSWTNVVTIASHPDETATMRPPVGRYNVVDFNGSQKYIVFDRIVFDAINCQDNVIHLGKTVSYIKFSNGEMKNAPHQGALIQGPSHQFVNMKIYDNGRTKTYDHGLYITSSNNLVEGSEIYHNAAYGVHIYNGSSGSENTANNNIVRSNRIYDNGRLGGISIYGIILGSGNGNVAYNNLIWGNPNGIQVRYKAPIGTQIYNNTIYGNDNYGILIGSNSQNTLVKNNIIYKNGPANNSTIIRNDGIGTFLSNNLSTDPQFVDAEAGDFTLKSGSSAIDKGVGIGMVDDDFAGLPRPQGSTYDIGAYEYKKTTLLAPSNFRVMSD